MECGGLGGHHVGRAHGHGRQDWAHLQAPRRCAARRRQDLARCRACAGAASEVRGRGCAALAVRRHRFRHRLTRQGRHPLAGLVGRTDAEGIDLLPGRAPPFLGVVIFTAIDTTGGLRSRRRQGQIELERQYIINAAGLEIGGARTAHLVRAGGGGGGGARNEDVAAGLGFPAGAAQIGGRGLARFAPPARDLTPGEQHRMPTWAARVACVCVAGCWRMC
mmetsp:Transcript_97211/g.270537  ORF Transcript_97211/g.270537 Transcript_97211/m.270537 type:complete len:220 (-) Transcript_97211:8-667(-)